MISLRHLTIFKTVSETGNFTKAAQRLYLTQSAVSHAIRELEQCTGVVLFDRLSKQVQLTANGKILLEEINPILSAYEALEKRIGHLEQQAPLHIVSSITIASFWLPNLLKKVKSQLPDTPVYVNVVSAAEAVKILLKGDADIAFVEGAKPQGPFTCKCFDNYQLNIVASPEYPVSSRSMDAAAFCQESLLLREVGSAIRDTLDSQLFLLGHTVHPRWVSVNSTALIQAAKAGLGITVLPEVLVKDELSKKTLILLNVEGLSLKNDMVAVWHKNKHLTPALNALLSWIS